MSEQKPKVPFGVSKSAQIGVQRALTSRFEAYLEPGEKIILNLENEPEFLFVHFVVRKADRSFQLDLEAALILQEQPFDSLQHLSEEHRFQRVIEFLSEQLLQFFISKRRARYHVDWRVYPLEPMNVRFRGRVRSPDLEAQADKLLDEETEGEEL